MNKVKIFFKNLFSNLKSLLFSIYRRSYGLDSLNKLILIIYIISIFINTFIKSIYLYSLSCVLFLLFIFRYFSSNKVKRANENSKYLRLIKIIKLKIEYRKTYKIFVCKKCKQIIRIPRGQGRIEFTCPSCGNKEIHRT